jgi:hypothetical protein
VVGYQRIKGFAFIRSTERRRTNDFQREQRGIAGLPAEITIVKVRNKQAKFSETFLIS